MIVLDAWRYDGNSSARVPVKLHVFATHVLLVMDKDIKRYDIHELTLQPRIAGTHVQLDFTDGSQCEIFDQPQLDAAIAMLPHTGVHGLIHKIESHWPSIILVLGLAVAVLYGLIQYAIPQMARHVAMAIPVEMETEMGRETLRVFEQFMQSSKLETARQDELRAQFNSLAELANIKPDKILFRHSDALGANAFALPAGTIVFTDELVLMAKDDRELIGVFAHELGHVYHRHTLQQVLQNTTTGLLLILLTGDISSVSSLAAVVPTVLVQTKFSRAAERESDDYAMILLAKQGISAEHLGNILQRMQAEADGELPAFLSTHPATAERIEKFNSP